MNDDVKQPASGTLTPEDRATEFVPVVGGGESASAGSLLVWAYLLMWALLFGFVVTTWRRQHQVATRLDRIERALSKAGEGA
ncbi:MAG: CcmD family protein [Polyangiaceae bacterium]|nr:CcmD family protein [Polyangiaceae bacterium]MCW5791116.1 CcmD family protein [Polyangiaceae bacterium]